MVYKIRVILDAKETIFRDVEIKDKQTLWNLHLGIKSAFSLPGEELSSFYFSDDVTDYVCHYSQQKKYYKKRQTCHNGICKLCGYGVVCSGLLQQYVCHIKIACGFLSLCSYLFFNTV